MGGGGAVLPHRPGDFVAVAREIARCLRPGGRFIYLGLHPCFIGPFSNRMNESA
jgi:SAM-dependent methyltransferase